MNSSGDLGPLGEGAECGSAFFLYQPSDPLGNLGPAAPALNASAPASPAAPRPPRPPRAAHGRKRSRSAGDLRGG